MHTPRTLRSTARRWGLVAVCVALAAVASCGDGGDMTASGIVVAEDGRLRVIGEDIVFDAATYEAEAGEIEIVYENKGRIIHTLVIEGIDDFKLTVRSNGDTAVGTVDLEPGDYVMYCDVPGHRRQGMVTTLAVS